MYRCQCKLKNKAQEQGWGDTIDFRVHEAVGSICLVPMFSPGKRGNEAKGRERVGEGRGGGEGGML